MPNYIRDFCDWCARILQSLQDFWSMMVNMLIHDYRYNWGDSPLVIRMEDVELKTNRYPRYDSETAKEAFPRVHYTVEKQRQRGQRIQPQNNENYDSDDDDIDGSSPLYVMYQPRPFINYSTNADNIVYPSTSKM